MTWIRALAAAGLSLVLPGAGHALLRDWIRAVFFAGLFVMTVAFFVPVADLAAAESTSEAMAVLEEEHWAVQASLSFVFLLAAVDAGFRAMGLAPGDQHADSGPTCPHCGRELDEELEFCHWCTTRLPTEEEDVVDA